MAKRPTKAELQMDVEMLEVDKRFLLRQLECRDAQLAQLQAMYNRMLDVMARAFAEGDVSRAMHMQQPTPDAKALYRPTRRLSREEMRASHVAAKDQQSGEAAQSAQSHSELSTGQIVEKALDTLNECGERYAFRSQYGTPQPAPDAAKSDPDWMTLGGLLEIARQNDERRRREFSEALFSVSPAATAAEPDNADGGGAALASYMREHPMETEDEARRALGLGGGHGSGGAE
jgi:hypothetical protein